MSGVVYSHNNPENYYEDIDIEKLSNSGTPRNYSEGEAKLRTAPASSPKKPPRPLSMAGAAPRKQNGQHSRDTSIDLEMDDVDVADARPSRHPKTSSPKVPAVSTISSRPNPDKTASPKKQLTEEEKKRQVLKHRIQAADKPEDADDDDYENSFVQRFKKPIMVILVLLLLAFSIAIGVGARNAANVTFEGAFAKTEGSDCSKLCLPTENYPSAPLVVIALNGFAKEFLSERKLVKNLARLGDCGVIGNTIPSYPSTAIPNLYSIVTGIHPSYQGKAGDWLRAYGMNSTEFGPGNYPNSYSRRDPRWFQTNGLWGTAADSGMLTASHSWIGRQGDIDEDRPPSPSYYQTYHSGVNYRDRIQTVLNWLHLEPSKRPGFITVYFEDPGQTAMKYGMKASQTMDSLAKVDSAIGLLLDQLLKDGHLGCVNIMVVSTGGMAEKNCDRVSYLSDDLNEVDKYTLFPDSVTSVGRITATNESPRNLDTAQEILDHLQCKVDHGKVYTKHLLPVQLHASYGLQREDTMVLMDEGWTFAKQQEGYNRSVCRGASDGFNPFSAKMQGVFIGYGKSFKTGTRVSTVKNVDLYNLMAELINVIPRNNNGTAGLLRAALVAPRTVDTDDVEFAFASNNECGYPRDDIEYDRRQRVSETECACSQATLDSYSETRDVVLKDMDENLRRTNSDSSTTKNAPFGLPSIRRHFGPPGQEGAQSPNYCLLHQNNFLSAYDNFLKIPFYASLEVRKDSPSTRQIVNCVRYDVRLAPENTPKCSSYKSSKNPQLPSGMEYGFLYSPALADSIDNEFNALLSSNIVPQYPAFKNDVWMPLVRRIKEIANQRNRSSTVNVLIGPVYDWNADTWRDSYFDVASSDAWVKSTPVPTHYFVVISRCLQDTGLRSCELSSLEVFSFILPHTNSARICQTMDDYLSTHQATVQDVELITGLVLFPNLRDDSESGIEMLKFKTSLPDKSLWIQA
ncbi:ectonucleotide pyrophosphatase/phosphodiesterase family member 3-like isoform X1 [Asterias rubens]|uniref:ectonucleotide pyrophosphatase/phosphodiesterase family member 3-like isoform X1 n=1 Tax=Asterias rubens TaxID=7604 RepID=UPI0014556BAD|nr:ectonucleotide pyrophosphatase/phosphodiesterase family member 3-like isoform X1 [Asterias rubens]